MVAEYRGDYELALEYHGRALALREELGDRWAIAVSLTNLGTILVQQEDYATARTRFEEAMRLNREVGDAWMVAISDNNLGNAARGLGDHEAACRHYAASLRAYRDYDDAWAVAFLLEDIAELAAMLDQTGARVRARRRSRRVACRDRRAAGTGERAPPGGDDRRARRVARPRRTGSVPRERTPARRRWGISPGARRCAEPEVEADSHTH